MYIINCVFKMVKSGATRSSSRKVTTKAHKTIAKATRTIPTAHVTIGIAQLDLSDGTDRATFHAMVQHVTASLAAVQEQVRALHVTAMEGMPKGAYYKENMAAVDGHQTDVFKQFTNLGQELINLSACVCIAINAENM